MRGEEGGGERRERRGRGRGGEGGRRGEERKGEGRGGEEREERIGEGKGEGRGGEKREGDQWKRVFPRNLRYLGRLISRGKTTSDSFLRHRRV